MKRIVLIVTLVLACSLSCGGSQIFHTMSGAFATCAEADLGQIMSNGLTLLSDVSTLIEGNAASLEADLTALAEIVTVDAVECAIAAVEAVLAPAPVPSGSGSSTPLLVPPPKPPGLVRADAWVAKQEAAKQAAKQRH